MTTCCKCGCTSLGYQYLVGSYRCCERCLPIEVESLRQQLAEARALLAVRQVCEWKYDDTHEKYGTTCGHAWQFIDDGIAENGVHFCPFCGGFITEAASAGGE